jgi:sulfur carrier protein ThiS
MRLTIDGLPADVPEGLSLLEILRRRGDPAGHVLVELNGRHVRFEELSKTFPVPGDVIEVILPAVGG